MEDISKKLINKLTELTEKEIIEFKIKAAIFERKLEEKMYSSIKEIELRLDEEIEYYNQNPENYKEYKDEILNKYKKEFEKIAKEFELQFINICEELQETQVNQKIAIANCRKMKNQKDEYLSSEKYLDYKKLKTKYKNDMDNSLTKAEFEKNMVLLNELKNPIEEYDNRIKAHIVKVKDYEEIIEKCSQKITECLTDAVEELGKVVSKKTSQLQIYNKSNYLIKIFDKISNIFSGKKKVKIHLIDRAPSEIAEIEKFADESKEKTKEDTIGFIEQLINYRNNIKIRYKEIAGI